MQTLFDYYLNNSSTTSLITNLSAQVVCINTSLQSLNLSLCNAPFYNKVFYFSTLCVSTISWFDLHYLTSYNHTYLTESLPTILESIKISNTISSECNSRLTTCLPDMLQALDKKINLLASQPINLIDGQRNIPIVRDVPVSPALRALGYHL